MAGSTGGLLDALIAGKMLEDSKGDRWVRKPDGTLRLIRGGIEMPVNDSMYTLSSFIRWIDKSDVRIVDVEAEAEAEAEEAEAEEVDW